MPRIPYSLILRARRIDPLLPLLLRECRDLCSARNELRWLTEFAQSRDAGVRPGWRRKRRLRLQSLVKQRAAGKPLQYILGDQPFGDLEILCKEGVLIPRPDTESYTTRIAQRLLASYQNQPGRTIRIIDLCTGTGCIPLLLHSLLAPSMPNISIVGVDISPIALALAKKNLEHNIQNGSLLSRARDEVQFVQADILAPHTLDPDGSELGALLASPPDTPSDQGQVHGWDLLISNPPYISPYEFANGTTKRSVRLYEPTLALVPPPIQRSNMSHTATTSNSVRADSFYPRLLDISAQLGARFTVLECGDLAQARRVAALTGDPSLSRNTGSEVNKKTEIWRCDWDIYAHDGASPSNNSIDESELGPTTTMEDSHDRDHGPRMTAESGARAVVVSRCQPRDEDGPSQYNT
ncbi:hypothetical protein FQN49_002840 [Arthroderma sp. PD_2]|nr:hypothetical protein FQN49_002840 [Arthroderma sp. PD_2]